MQALMHPVDTADNKFHDGDPVTGEMGTIVSAGHLNNVQAAVRDVQTELISILTAAGMSPDSAALQVLNALKEIFQAKDSGLTSLAALVGGANKLPYYTAADVFAQTDLTSIGRDILGKTSAALVLQYLAGAPLASPVFTGTPAAPTAGYQTNTTQLATTAFVHAASSGVIGDSRNAAISLATASASATFTADEVVVGTALGGAVWRMSNISKTINLATTGAGGMDTGSAPASGWVAIYLIYNPTTNTSALLAQNATSVVAPTVYGGANMPSGYTASALVSVWRTTAASILLNGYQRGRKFCIPRVDVLNTSSNPGGYTPIPLSAAVPLNAISASGYVFCNSGSGSGFAAFSVGSDANGLGYFQVYAGLTGSLGSDIYFESMLPVAQNLFYTFTWTTSAASSATLGISGYTI